MDSHTLRPSLSSPCLLAPVDMHLLTFDQLFEYIHYPADSMPAQCMAFHIPFHPKIADWWKTHIPTFS